MRRRKWRRSLIAKIGSDSLHDLVTNPLTTSLVCFVFNETGGELPPSKAKLYEELTRCVLLRKYKKDRREPLRIPSRPTKKSWQFLGTWLSRASTKVNYISRNTNSTPKAAPAMCYVLVFSSESRPHRSELILLMASSLFTRLSKSTLPHYLCTQLLSHDSDDCLRLLDNKTEEELSHQYKQVLRFLVEMSCAKGEQAKSVGYKEFTGANPQLGIAFI